jgi:hypothetical protein
MNKCTARKGWSGWTPPRDWRMCCNAITLNLCISGCQLPLHSLCGTRPRIPTIPSLFICVGPPECFVHTKIGCAQCTRIPKLKSSHKLKGYASSQCKF